ncbi:MAG TPA: LAGLIDADG family homing endonuclease [Candidatus Binatia bacterium]|nr:LAGLIDADG family homing endonuclease [Candidatus Binatia bacterium]
METKQGMKRNALGRFEPKPVPPKEELSTRYVHDLQSASALARHYGTAVITVQNWIRAAGIPVRNLKESMKLENVRAILAEKRLRKPTLHHDFLWKDKAYLLGVAYGDGFLSTTRFRVEVCDLDFLQEVQRALFSVYGLNFTIIQTSRGTYKIDLANRILCEDLSHYGPTGTFVWRVPKAIRGSFDEMVVAAFLKGMFDSEGSVSKYSILLACKNPEGVAGLFPLLKRLGIKAGGHVNARGVSYLWITHRKNRSLFAEKIGFSIQRKQARLEASL